MNVANQQIVFDSRHLLIGNDKNDLGMNLQMKKNIILWITIGA